ncbi:MAG TPA: zinc-ribbon domain-containing protein [Polyangiaceae bacterium]|nr:zinc-ribbon domain-containing protein [Polyangiaceae bacterium]
MDVRCGRCGTEYEFDDALISERGTTVKCTNCGYQFKVFPDAAAAAPERWVVRTVAGRELVYTTLKDLQRGIAKGHVGANDMLARGNRPARPLSAIPELEPFLRPGSATIPQRRPPRTLQGVAPAANASAGGEAPASVALPQRTPSIAPAGARPQSFTPAWEQPRDAPRSDAPTVSALAAPSEARAPAPSEARAPAPSEVRASAPSASRSARPAPEGVRFPNPVGTATLPGGVSLTAATVKRTPPGGVGLLHDLPSPPGQVNERAKPGVHFEATEPPTIPRYFTGPDGAPQSQPSPQQPALPQPAPQNLLPQQPAGQNPLPHNPLPHNPLPHNPLPQNPLPQQSAAWEPALPAPAARAPEAQEPAQPQPTPIRGDRTPGRGAAREQPVDAVTRLQEARALLQHDDETDPHYVHSPTQRNARSRWLVLVVVLAAGGLLAGTVGKRYLAKYTKGRELAASQTDATVTGLLTEGERLLARGELEGAKDAFSKASARAENDRQVLTSLAKLEVVRADLLWLEQRLHEAQGEALLEETRRELARQVVRVRGAVERLKLSAPQAAETARLLVHAKRLGGEVAEARRHVAALTKDASLPENAYALALLDMADEAPVWSSIVHRLRIAAGAEGPLGLARAALVYALARSNDADAANAELEKLAKARPSHPLISDLRTFLERSAATAGDAGAEPVSDEPDAADSAIGAGPAGVGGDFRAQLKQAYTAVERGQLAQGERLYNAVLAKQPGNTEALSGLADIAHRRNDSKKASRLYEEVLRKNPSYLPALMANADQKWASGDRAEAVVLYRRILEQAGADSSYGRRSAQRIAQAEQTANTERDRNPVTEPAAPADSAPDSVSGDTVSGDAGPPDDPAPDAPGSSSEPAPPSEPEGSEAPHIDTTDLPEVNQ